MNISRPHTSRLARLVRPVLTSVRGVVDLASIMVGVIVLGVIAAGALVTVFGVIPWTQDNAAKQDLGAVSTAQSVAYVDNSTYLDVDGLVENGYLSGVAAAAYDPFGTITGGHSGGVFAAAAGADKPQPLAPGQLRARAGDNGHCYVAVAASGSGHKFVTTNTSAGAEAWTPDSDYDCDGVDVPALIDEVTPSFVTTSLDDGIVGDDYTDTVTATGSGTITYQVTDGALPDGLSLDKDTGQITGTPTGDGEFEFTITAHNHAGDTGRDYVIPVYEKPAITTSSFADGQVGEDYSQTITATGSDPIVYTVGAGDALPDGLSLDENTGELTGTPTVAGEFDVTVIATNSGGTDSVTVRLYVEIAAPKITTTSLPNGQVGVSYSGTVKSSGTSVTYKVTSGSLPRGLSLNRNSGKITGKPKDSGNASFTITATNAGGTDTVAMALRIKPIPKMVSTWDTTLIDDTEITLPLHGGIDATIDWGDGTETEATEGASHDYANDGTYTVTVHGTFDGWGELVSHWTPGAVTGVTEWQSTETTNLRRSFYGAVNFTTLDEIPNGVTNMGDMFRGASSFDQPLDFDTSQVTNMNSMFRGASSFNQPLDNFDTSNVTNMGGMFYGASSFDQPLDFDTSQVTNMSNMFNRATAFNQPLDFDTSNVTNMHYMFWDATSFNNGGQPLDFDTSKVTDMSSMFRGASSFNQPLDFDTSNVTNMHYMFWGATSFNQDLSGWDVSSVTRHTTFADSSGLTSDHLPNFP